MPDFTFPELNSDQATETADTLRNAANAAANAVCDLYENYPRGVIPSFGDPTGVGAFTDGLLNRLCAPRGKTPTPPALPFTGGQCVCIQYRVMGTINGFGIGSSNFDLFAQGPIGGIVNNKQGGSDNRYGFFSGAAACGGRVFNGVIQSALDGTVVITSVTPFPVVPDTCGNPPVEYPDVVIPPIAFSPNITVGLPGGSVSIPVTVIPTVFAPLTVFRPEFNVDVGGINVNFNLGGVDLTLNLPGGNPIRLPPGDSRPVPPPSTPPREPVPSPCDLTEVIDLLEDIKECACDEPRNLLSTSFGLARGRAIALPPDTQYVVLEVFPSTGLKMQVGEGTAPDVYFAGWYSFGRGTSGGERIPISFLQSSLFAPEGASTFSYSLNFGAEATLNVFYFEENQ